MKLTDGYVPKRNFHYQFYMNSQSCQKEAISKHAARKETHRSEAHARMEYRLCSSLPREHRHSYSVMDSKIEKWPLTKSGRIK